MRKTVVKEKGTSINAVNAHLKQFQEMAKRFNDYFVPIQKQHEAFQKSIQPIIEAQKTFQQSLEPFLAELEHRTKLMESVRIPQNAFLEISHLTKPVLELQKFIRDFRSPALEQLQRDFLEQPPRTQEALLLLGAHGWYLDLEMPFSSVWKLKKALSEGNVEEAEGALAEYFDSRLDSIEASIIKRFPRRAKIIRAAFNAHRREEYELSIPVLIAQTDGICNEIAKQYLFIKQNKKPRTAIYVEQITLTAFRSALLSPLAHPLPIGFSENDRPKDSKELNRHTVLHGESLDYGTKVNGLKAISLINYVAHVLTMDNENS